jgi:hypothetical protein
MFFNFDLNFDLDLEKKHVFKNTIDLSFINSLEKHIYKSFIFKLYETMINWILYK